VVAHPKMMSGQIGQKICAWIVKMIVDSLWFYPILGIVGLAILYWFN